MKIPSRARYSYCNTRACEFLEEFNITTFPVDPWTIIRKNKWGIAPYSELMNNFNCTREKIQKLLGSKDGFTAWDHFNYTISYNDDYRLGDRVRFTLMHEIGHIYLNHLVDFEATILRRNSLTKDENQALENEANAFARNVLVPTVMLDYLTDKSVKNISTTFGITSAAAKARLSFYLNDIKENKNYNILERLRLILYKILYKKTCSICNYEVVSKDDIFCPICGSKNSWQRKGGKMKYPIKIKLDKNSKAIRCPVCDNEDIPSEGSYCPICGTMIVNRCSCNPDDYVEGCGLPAAGNARYCIYCGCETTFFKNNILKAWNQSDFDSPEELPFN